MNIITPVTKSPVRGLKERNCWAFTIHTQELSKDQFERLTEMDEYCLMLLSDTGISKDQIREIEGVSIKKEKKQTRSQEMRFQLQLLYDYDNEGHEVFEDYYDSKMSKWIEMLKNKVREKEVV